MPISALGSERRDPPSTLQRRGAPEIAFLDRCSIQPMRLARGEAKVRQSLLGSAHGHRSFRAAKRQPEISLATAFVMLNEIKSTCGSNHIECEEMQSQRRFTSPPPATRRVPNKSSPVYKFKAAKSFRSSQKCNKYREIARDSARNSIYKLRVSLQGALCPPGDVTAPTCIYALPKFDAWEETLSAQVAEGAATGIPFIQELHIKYRLYQRMTQPF